MERLRRGLEGMIDLLLPRVCMVCGGRLLQFEKHICISCAMDMPYTRFWQMSHNPMADRFNELIQRNLNDEHEHYAYAAALFLYHSEAGYRHIPYQIKYHGNIEAGEHFGHMLGERMAAESLWADVDIMIPVPLHWVRKWKRGYNQAEVIARAVAERLDVPLRTDILMRHRRTRTQTQLDIEGKAKNVADAFSVRQDAVSIFPNGGSIRHIVLVDDVFTSGSTLHACFKALRTVFPPQVRISVATLAFVGGA